MVGIAKAFTGLGFVEVELPGLDLEGRSGLSCECFEMGDWVLYCCGIKEGKNCVYAVGIRVSLIRAKKCLKLVASGMTGYKETIDRSAFELDSGEEVLDIQE